MKKIKLTRGLFALVDNEDFERLNAFKWCAHRSSRGTKDYAVRWLKKGESGNHKGKHVRMHYDVLRLAPGDLPPGHVIDHVNHDGLDCRKIQCGAVDGDDIGKLQLEIVTQEENMRRSFGFKKKGMVYATEPVADSIELL